MYWNFEFGFVKLDCPDTNISDEQMFETCDQVSPNVRLCYRALNFARHYLFPCGVKTARNELT